MKEMQRESPQAAEEIAEGKGRQSPDVHAHNTFENPRAVEPRDETVRVGTGGALSFRFPAASVTRLLITLA